MKLIYFFFTRTTLTLITFVVCLIQIFFIFVSVSVANSDYIYLIFSLGKRGKKISMKRRMCKVLSNKIYSNNKNDFHWFFTHILLCNFHFIDRLLFIFHFISSFGGTFNDNDSTAHDVWKMSLHLATRLLSVENMRENALR